MLRMIGFSEGIGSGFPLILSASEEKHWARPELIEEQDLMQVKLVIYIDKRIKNVTNDVIKGNENVIKELTECQKLIVKILIGEPSCTVDDLSDRLGVTWRTIMRDIEKLKKLNVVTREGGRAEGCWIVTLDKE